MVLECVWDPVSTLDTILKRFWWILEGFWKDFEWILEGFWKDFGKVFGKIWLYNIFKVFRKHLMLKDLL